MIKPPCPDHIGDEARKYFHSRSPLWCVIFLTLREHQMSNMAQADDPTSAYPLVDLFSNPGSTIETGEWEMCCLADELTLAIENVSPQEPTS